ncbi:hypothetical protein Trco_004142 [Trichoderma cornu-damae]|uniref:Uncharacterized protein n=1 Tax=Trichoderma cornu-damae TaxID=654480 RepID=A0A9P8QMF6_9HYPO|nr:hypothetical protein Trco_004142 [Trichoderma cornu-damae]
MRGLGKAATLMLAPTAALTRPVRATPMPLRAQTDAPNDAAFAVAVAVDTSSSAVAKAADQTLVFNLDIQESPEACSRAKVRIDGFLLSQDDNGAGQGTFASLDGHTVAASWNFTCREHARRVPWDQDLAVTIMSLDGEAVPETTFFTSFRQRTPAKVYDVGGDSVVYTTEGHAPSRLGEKEVLDRIRAMTGSADVGGEVGAEIKAEIKDIISMERQIRELGEVVHAKQEKVLGGLGIRPSAPAFNLQTFYQTAKLASSTLRGTMEHWLSSVLGFPVDGTNHGFRHHHHHHHHHDGSPPHRSHNQNHHHHHPPHHRDDGLVVSMQVDGQGGQHFFYYRDNGGSARLIPHISYLPLFATIFTFHLALFFILRSVRRRIHSRHPRREARARRRVQRRARRAGFEQTAGNLLCRMRDFLPFRAERVELNEKTSMLVMREEETSMEDELAAFQEAASVVGDMVAAQERRAARADGTQPPRFTEDVSPPAYDELEEAHDEKRPDGCGC